MASEGRRLAAVMFTDIVGYTALTQLNEARALALLDRHYELLRPLFPRFRGREVKTMGDSFLVEFADALDAATCAIEIQRFLRESNQAQPPEDRVRVRIGLHLGEVVERTGDILGDTVNVAARIEPLAEPDGVCVTGPVFEAVRHQVPFPFEKLDPKPLKNVRFPPAVYRIVLPWSGAEPPLVARSARNRIAVLPFANLSPSAEDSYLADGLTEEIIAVLAEVPGLRVVSRTSVEAYKTRERSLRQIGDDLHVDTVLEGSVRRGGDRLRITVQLIQTDTDEHLWAERYDRALEDVLAIQAEIARTVAESLRTRLHAEIAEAVAPPPSIRSESYLEYLKGWALLRGAGEETFREAKTHFERALALDGRNARACVGLSRVTRALGRYSRAPREEVLRASRTLVERALALDPNLAEAHGSLGSHLMFEYRWAEAEREYSLALASNPSNAIGHASYALLLTILGRFEDALREYALAEEAEPLAPPVYGQVVLLMALGRLDEARAKLQKLAATETTGSTTYDWAAFSYGLHTRDFATALRHLERVEATEGAHIDTLNMRAAYYALAGDRENAERALRELKALPDTLQYRDDTIAQIYGYLGETDECFRWLNRAFEKRDLGFDGWRNDSSLAPITQDPRFHSLLRRANLE